MLRRSSWVNGLRSIRRVDTSFGSRVFSARPEGGGDARDRWTPSLMVWNEASRSRCSRIGLCLRATSTTWRAPSITWSVPTQHPACITA